MIAYRRRASALHAARPSAGVLFCVALALPALLFDHPLVIVAAGAGLVLAGTLAGVGGELRRAATLAIPLALLTALINPLVSHDGLTVIARLGTYPVLGRVDVTLEALALGAIQGLRVGVVVLAGALYTAAIDPDEVLRGLRRLSLRSALTASVATRLVPVLVHDGAQIADAQRCRPGAPAGRVAVLRAVTANALDRAVDVAAALEVRGFAAARRPPSRHRPLSRADLWVGGAALALIVLTVAARAADVATFTATPAVSAGSWDGPLALSALIVLLAALPFRVRRGIG